MADNDLVPLLLLGGAGYLAWRYWPQLQASFTGPLTKTGTTTPAASTWRDPGSGSTPNYSTASAPQYSPAPAASKPAVTSSSSLFSSLFKNAAPSQSAGLTYNRQIIPTDARDIRSTGINPTYGALAYRDPNYDYAQSVIQSQQDALSKTHVLMSSPNVGTSAPDAKAYYDPDWDRWEAYRQKCTAITGAPILPPPPGCTPPS